MTDSILTLGFLPAAWKRSHHKDVAVMAAGAVIGIPLGTYILNHADPLPLRWGIAVVAAMMLALLISGWRY